MERKLNHLKTFEAYTNEEFNQFKKEDWKETGKDVRKGLGFLTPEEEIEKGKSVIQKNRYWKEAYEKFLKEDPDKAEKFLKFMANNDDANLSVKWLKDERKFIDSSTRYGSPGSIGAGN